MGLTPNNLSEAMSRYFQNQIVGTQVTPDHLMLVRLKTTDLTGELEKIPNRNKTLEEAYQVLGISPDATDDEVRRAYKKMALENHPDRVATLGDDIKAAAEKKFQKIGEAKDRIFKARGMK